MSNLAAGSTLSLFARECLLSKSSYLSQCRAPFNPAHHFVIHDLLGEHIKTLPGIKKMKNKDPIHFKGHPECLIFLLLFTPLS